MDRTKRIMVKALNSDQFSLRSEERPLDYGHCKEIMADKYGEERATKMYDGMIDFASSGSYFKVAATILKEKRSMMVLLGLDAHNLEAHSYEELYDRWQESKR